MRLLFCGTRGSIPAPGPEFVRYGGNTSCVAVSHDGEAPSLILDGGTGLRGLARSLRDAPFRGTILLGHLHWDHMLGLPFFRSADHPDSRTSVLVPAQGDAEALLERAIGPPNFPLRPNELRGHWTFANIDEETREVEGFAVTAREIPHPGGRAFGYRVQDATGAIAYLSDHSPLTIGPGSDGLGAYHAAAKLLVSGVDLLIHDAQHLAAEMPAKAFLGHSAVEYVIGLATHCGVRRVLLYHHDPDRTDDEIDAIVAAHQDEPVPVAAAMEGETIDVRRAAR